MFPTISQINENVKFNKIGLMSSCIFFLVYFIYLVLKINSKNNVSLKINDTYVIGENVFLTLLINTLGLPIVYFGIKGIIALRNNDKVSACQKFVMCLYFIIMFVGLTIHLVDFNDDINVRQHKDKTDTVDDLKLFILPILLILSTYFLYNQYIIKRINILDGKFKYMNMAIVVLPLLYYTTIFDSVKFDSKMSEGISILKAILSFVLAGLFFMASYQF